MSDVESEITAWRSDMARDPRFTPEILDELEDHLREALQQHEPSVSDAARSLGQGSAMAKEFEKTQARECVVLTAIGGRPVKKSGRFNLVNALVWAAVMLATAWLAPDQSKALLPILIGGWFITQNAGSGGTTAAQEIACLRRTLKI